MKTILITGASGLIGGRLTEILLQKGYIVSHLSQNKQQTSRSNVKSYNWDISKSTIDLTAVEQADAIIHLAGENIAGKRWSFKQKKEIVTSRTSSIQLLFNAIEKCNHKPTVFISASAVGYYGAVTSDKNFKETDLPGNDFLANTCIAWEKAADTIAALGIRIVKMRTGIVLSAKGGALQKIAKPVNYFIGSALGTGKQYMPWIDIDDLCNMYIKAIEDNHMLGAYNAVAPEHVNNKAFTVALAKQLHKPLFMPKVPAFVLKILMGEMACIVLEGSRISSEKIEKSGFNFKYPTLNKSLAAIFTA